MSYFQNLRRFACGFSLTASSILLVATGCNSGGSGNDTVTPGNSVRVDSVTVSQVGGGTQVDFTLVSNDESPATVAVAFSENRGLNYATTDVDGDSEGLASSSGGVTHTVLWDHNADVSSPSQGDLVVRITPTNEKTGATSAPSYSAVFSIGANSAPQINSVDTPTEVQGSEVVVSYSVSDAQSDLVELQLEYSVDDGDSWEPATAGTTGDGIEAVSTSPTPVTHMVSWFPQVDIPGMTSGTAMLRLTAIDVTAGNTLATNLFSLNLVTPEIDLITIADIAKEMNGSENYTSDTGAVVDFHVQVPPSGFELVIEFSDTPGGQPVDSDSLEVTCDRPLGAYAVGDDFGGEFTIDGNRASWIVADEYALPGGLAVFTARISDTVGNPSGGYDYEVEVVSASGGRRPFDINDTWWLDFTRDQFSISHSGTNTISVTSTIGANGVPDFNEDLEIVGLRSQDPLAQNSSANATVLELVKETTIGHLNRLYGGDFNGDGTDLFSPNLRFTDTPGGHRSSIRIGGDDSVPGYTLGRAHFDHRNASGNANTSTSLGVFSTNFISYYINASSMFRARFDQLIPGRGTPVGEHSLDAVVLHSSFERLSNTNTAAENLRYDEIFVALDAFARSVAVICAHEVGHSLGLCSNGPLPQGLFGNVRGPVWSGGYTNSFHFDSPGTNIMAAALSFSGSISQGTNSYHFNDVNRAYLSEMILLD